jgi:putative transposase
MEGGLFFFTVALADRSSDLLLRRIDRARRAYAVVQERRPFETVAICILPDRLHSPWRLPDGDSDYASRWSLFKSGFTRKLPPAATLREQNCQARERNWQRRYWENTIRDDADLERHADYIH